MAAPLTLGAVAYDPKVVTIWEGFAAWFGAAGFPIDFILFSNYEAQVEAHLAGAVDITWDSPLAWVRSRRLATAAGRRAHAVAMRDSDQDLTSVVLVRADDRDGVESIAELSGRRIATGAADSPQSTLLPLAHLSDSGLAPDGYELRRFDVGIGKHGDHIGGERQAVEALVRGDVDAACVIDGNHLAFAREGTIPVGAVRVLTRTPPFDHCTMTTFDDHRAAEIQRFVELLLSMSYDDPEVRPLLDLEGLTEWRPGRTAGFGQLERAVDLFSVYSRDGTRPGR